MAGARTRAAIWNREAALPAAPGRDAARSSGAIDSGQPSSLTRDIRGSLGLLRVLTKFNIAVLSTFSAGTGYLLAARSLHWEMVVALAGTLLLSCGAGALNEVQEWKSDALMARTRRRPIPAGLITPSEGLLVSLLLLAGGEAVLLLGVGALGALLGAAAVASYNLLYTPLKRVTAFAVVPGSIIGAIPPAIGWVAGGGRLADGGLLALGFFFFVWQIPHFWLLLLKYGDQYERAGFPTLTQVFSPVQLSRITCVWMMATAFSSLLLPLFDVVRSLPSVVALALCAAGLTWASRKLLAAGEGFSPGAAFMQINLFALAVMLACALDPLFVHLLQPRF
ncbi:MAG: protoheme IX farnesyltransferase [Acidobacteriota bacterium]